VVASLEDPNPRVAGSGFAYLRAAGIEVVVGPGAAASRELNLGFFSRMLRQRPWVRLKIAASLDGRTALENGQSQWITGEAARTDGHAWRARACALLTGIGTVLEDDPQLDVRLLPCDRQPALVVVDSRLQTPLAAKLFRPQRSLLNLQRANRWQPNRGSASPRGHCDPPARAGAGWAKSGSGGHAARPGSARDQRAAY